MVNKDFFEALKVLEEEGIKQEYFIEALEAALSSAYKKNSGEAKGATVEINPEKHTINVYSYKTVVAEVLDPDKELSLADARANHKKTAKLGDVIRQKETPKEFGRIAAQTAKQVVMQKLKEAKRSKVMEDILNTKDSIITAIVRRVENDSVYLDLGAITQLEGILSDRDRIPGERYVPNTRIKAYVKGIKEIFGNPFVQVSRAHHNFVRKLFELEVPEIASGEIEIKNIVREPGYRTKITVHTEDSRIDPIGACVGNKGMRVNAIVNELNGEKIDIVPYSEDPVKFITAALSPATVLYIQLNPDDKSCLAVVPDDKLSLAIGKSGQNVRLAVKLTGWKIDVKAKSAVPSINITEENSDTESYDNLFDGEDAFAD